MKKEIVYKYLGTNGIIESPIYLEDIYSVKLNILTADAGYVLTDGLRQELSVKVPDKEVAEWREIHA